MILLFIILGFSNKKLIEMVEFCVFANNIIINSFLYKMHYLFFIAFNFA